MQNLKSRMRGGESARLEFKVTSPGPLKLAREICGLANSAGGVILVGVDDLGRIIGVDDPAAVRADFEAAIDMIEPSIESTIEQHVHDLRDVVGLDVQSIEFPDICALSDEGDRTVYFRVRNELRPIDRRVEKMIINLRRRARGETRLPADGKRLVEWLWDKGEATETVCADKLNYSSHRLRKLAESLIGTGHLVPCKIGEGRTYAAIRPAD